VTSFQWGGGDDFQHVVLTWPTVPGKSYRLMGSASLVEPDWMNLADLTALDESSTMLYFLPEGTKRLFFRVELVEEAEPMMARAATGHGPAAMLPTAVIDDADAAAAPQNPLSMQPVVTGEATGTLALVEEPLGDANLPMAAAGDRMSVPEAAAPSLGNRAVEFPTLPSRVAVEGEVFPGGSAGTAEKVVRVAEGKAAASPSKDKFAGDRVAGSAPGLPSLAPPPAVPVALPTRLSGATAPTDARGSVLAASTGESLAVHLPAEQLSPMQPRSAWLDLRQWWELLVSWLATLFTSSPEVAEIQSNGKL